MKNTPFKYKEIILFIILLIVPFGFLVVRAQSFLTDFENLQEELAQRTLPDFTRAYQEKVRIFDAWDEIKQSVASILSINHSFV